MRDDLQGMALGFRSPTLPLALATVILAATSVVLTSTTEPRRRRHPVRAASGRASAISVNREPGGASSVRGVGDKTINIAGRKRRFQHYSPRPRGGVRSAGHRLRRLVQRRRRHQRAQDRARQPRRPAVQRGDPNDRVLPERLHGGGRGLTPSTCQACRSVRSAGWDRSAPTSPRSPGRRPASRSTPEAPTWTRLPAGWFGALTKAYPNAVKKAGMGSGRHPPDVQPETKDEFAAEAQGWKVISFLLPPTSVENWAPYVESYQEKRSHGPMAGRHSQLSPLR